MLLPGQEKLRRSYRELGNRELGKVDEWMASNKLTLNYSKTKFMLVHRKNEQPLLNLYIKNHKIEQVKSIEYLVVRIDEKLNWSEQIKNVETKLSQACGAIARLRHFVDQKTLRTLYYAHAYSHLQYSVLAWGANTKRILNRLNVLHNRLIRLMCLHGPLHDMNFTNSELYKSMNILKFQDVYKLELAKIMFKAVNNCLPQTLNKYFPKKDNRRNLRSLVYDPFRIDRRNTLHYRRWLTTAGVELWNSLSSDLKKMSFFSFKKAMRKRLIEAYF